MEAHHRRQLIAQLNNRIPLVGGMLRRQAARALAEDASPEALGALAGALALTSDPDVRAIAQAAVQQASGPPKIPATQGVIDSVCAVWAGTRYPALGELIRAQGWVASAPPELRALSALQAGASEILAQAGADLVPPLVEILNDREPALAAQAAAALAHLADKAAIDALCARWARSRDPRLERILLDRGYVARRPAELRALTAVKTGHPEALRRAGEDSVPPLLGFLFDRDPAVSAGARAALRGLQNPAAQEAVCRLALEAPAPGARQAALEAALEAGYRPQDSHARALFLFLTGQWQAYDTLDFDRRLLGAAYAAAAPDLRRRVMDAVRNAVRTRGRADLLGVIAGGEGAGALSALSTDEGLFLVQMLAEHQEWPRLWPAALELPLPASLRAVQALSHAGWQADDEETRAAFAELAALANGEVDLAPGSVARFLPSAVRRARAQVPGGRINAVAFAPQGPRLAIATSARKVVLWDFQAAAVQETIGPCNHSIGELVYTPRGELVFGERTNRTQEPCAFYAWQGGRLQRMGATAGPVTALAAGPHGQVLVAGRDGSFGLWETAPAPRQISSGHAEAFWPRGGLITPDGLQAALLFDGVAFYTLPEFKFVWMNVHVINKSMVRSAAFTPEGQFLLLGMHNGKVFVHNPKNRSTAGAPLTAHTGAVAGVAVLARYNRVVTAGAEGELQFIAWPEGRVAGRQRSGGVGVTSLHISPDETFMALGDSDATISLWDLRPLEVPPLLNGSLASARPHHLPALRSILDSGAALPARARNTLRYLECLLQFRFRYDIELGGPQEIKAGEFDIELGMAKSK